MEQTNGFSERRGRTRGTPGGEPHRAELEALILGTYRELPGLSLHIHQAARLFGLRTVTCEVVLDDLVARGRLGRRHDRQYVAGTLERGASPAPLSRSPASTGSHRRA